MSLTIRPAVPEQDFGAVAALLSGYENEPISKEQLLENSRRSTNGGMDQRFVAEADQRIVGYAILLRQTWMPGGRFFVKVWALPDKRNKGIGAALYDAAVERARAYGATSFDSNVLDNEAHSMRFAEARGFTTIRHLFESEIDLRQFDPSRFEGVLEQVQASGIRLFTLADVGNTPENLYKLWDVNYTVYQDDPGATSPFPNFDEFQKLTGGASWFNPAGQFLAADGDTFVGLGALRHNAENKSCHNMMTGVLREYRGRKIALALKLLTIRYAQQLGALTITTDNDSQNAPMLAINRKLGYMPLPGVYRLLKETV
ncbi:MAG: GNAT family N-acetyltransferase [Chloroflexi bacterium]|nr:GNAT family N-acetyltransferase [Chloroflexota bacterium]MCC6896842.1 GNAT family N-acetyltransferase [Anaerolineae bacterium]